MCGCRGARPQASARSKAVRLPLSWLNITGDIDYAAGSCFLLGPRGTGKSTWLRARYPDAAWIDLLDAETERNYYTRPERLTKFLRAHAGRRTVVIDQIQRVPELLVTCQPPLPHRAGPECRAVPGAAAADGYSPASRYRSHADRGRGGSARLAGAGAAARGSLLPRTLLPPHLAP